MKSTRRIQISAAVGAVLLATLAGCSATSASTLESASNSSHGKITNINVSTIGISTDAGISLGVDQGYFKKQGLSIHTSVVANPAAGIAAVQSGHVALAYSPSISVLTALSNGIKLKVIAAADGYPADTMSLKNPGSVDDTAVYTTPGSGITRAKDLVGKTVAVPALKAQLQINIASAVKKDGGNPNDVHWVVLDFPSAVAALKSGKVQAAGLVDPFTSQAKANGDKLLLNPGVSFFRQGAVGLWVTNAKEAQNKSLMKKLQTAIYQSNAYADAHIEKADVRAAQITKVSLSVIKEGAPEYWPTTIKTSDIQRANKQLAGLGDLPKPVSLAGVIFPQPKK